jgi:vacuolar-type H+-ATPase subunit E/Vma4
MSSTIPSSTLDKQTEALMEQVTADRERRCAALRSAADEQARQIVHSARAEATRSVRNAVTQERARFEFGMRQAKAHAEIEARRQEQQQSGTLLQQMWAAITDALERRWREPALRRAWIDAALGQAAALLRGREWRIEGGSDWEDRDRDELTRQAQQRGAGGVEWSSEAAVPAGLKIRANGVCIDATVPGLLVNAAAIEAAFLAEYLPSLAPPSPSKEPQAHG